MLQLLLKEPAKVNEEGNTDEIPEAPVESETFHQKIDIELDSSEQEDEIIRKVEQNKEVRKKERCSVFTIIMIILTVISFLVIASLLLISQFYY